MASVDPDSRPRPFELSGGALCLDFANTWGNRDDLASDRLSTYERLLEFGKQTGGLAPGAARTLSRAAARSADKAGEALEFARELRQVVYDIFSARAGSRVLDSQDIDWINGVLGDALSRRRLERRSGEFCWSWIVPDGNDLRAPVWPVVESAAALLTADDLGRVRECRAEDCNWLFLDQSRSGSRCWCSMSSCGNRAKARRHYRRQRDC